ncbi:MAG: hypothetical protein FWC01_04960 [Treponema sp.]|nr:hypothetical protein [Treponema sp.]
MWSPKAFAQEVNYRVDIRYIQRLTWIHDEYAMRYEVIIEKYENRRYSNFFRDFTENDFIEVSLPPGNYRYQVIPYDYLNSPVSVTDWTEFTVLRAPENAERNFITEENHNVAEKFDFFIGIFFEPIIPVYNAQFFSGENMSLLGAQFRFGAVYGNQAFFNPGMELSGSWKMLSEIQMISVSLNFLGQVRMNERTALNFRAGFGVSLLSDMQGESLPEFNVFNVNLGISFIALVTRNFYFEAGADILQFISLDHFGYLCPWIGIGARF